MDFPKLRSKALLSPMAGVTDVAFRLLCKRYGAALTYTEFVNSIAIIRQSRRAYEMVKVAKEEHPVGVQLFGSSAEDIVQAAIHLEDRFDVIDVNCGCPAWKVVQTGAGSALLNNPEKIGHFISRLAGKTNKPVSLKIRAGIDSGHINAVEVAKKAEDAGASAIAVHGRTLKQGYTGKADWKIIKEVKQNVNIPVIGNGDIFSPEDYREKLEYSDVDFILIARGAMTNPFLFTQISDFMQKGSYEHRSKLEMYSEYLQLAQKHEIPFQQMKCHAMNFTKGITGGAKIRIAISASKEIKELKKALDLPPT